MALGVVRTGLVVLLKMSRTEKTVGSEWSEGRDDRVKETGGESARERVNMRIYDGERQ